MSSSRKLRLAVIGFGPSALGALESLVTQLIEIQVTAQIDIFDPFPSPGAGPNFDPDQSDLCILNIPVRVVDYGPPQFLASHIKPYIEWAAEQYQPDDFPPRSHIGTYLNQRFEAVCQAAGESVSITRYDSKITGLDCDENQWRITADTGRHGPYDEVMLTQGQPATSPDPQLAKWAEHAAENGLDLLQAYPANMLIAAARDWTGKSVAVRGMGLSTLDVIRMLTSGLGGEFVDGQYKLSGREPRRIIPFSLDGKPPAAKPATSLLDGRYDPTEQEVGAFKVALSKTVSSQPGDALKLICDALIAPATRILSQLNSPGTDEDVRIWLEIERTEPGAQEILGTVEGLKFDIEVAHGRTPPSVGYVVGQLWRKLQDELRQCFDENQHEIGTATALIGFDEAMKRFSYGPPVSAAEELLILITAGIVSIRAADDPGIGLNSSGWQLIEGDDILSAPIMIDAVLPSPNLETVIDPLVLQCVADGFMKSITNGMGAHTFPDGQLMREDGRAVRGLSMLGRLTLGSVIAVDGLDDCFGPSANRWATGVMDRIHR